MVNMEKHEKLINQKIECPEPLIAQLGNSTALKVPSAIKRDQPNWKKQNPRAYFNSQEDVFQLVYEWKASNGVIIAETQGQLLT